jgi:hypothetical protein
VSGKTPPAFNAIFFDTNILLANHWPEPAPALYNLLTLASWWKIGRCLPEAVLEEVECHWSRNVRSAADRLNSARQNLIKDAMPVSCEVTFDHTSLSTLQERFRESTEKAIAHFGISRIAFTQRTTQEIFGYAARYIAPFATEKEGKGFQDAVILLSILDHLRDHPDVRAVFVTKDSDFAKLDYRQFVPDFDPARLQVVDFERVFHDLYEPYFDETRVKPYRSLLEAAERMAKADLPRIGEFVVANLTAEILRPSPAEKIREILSVEKIDIRGVDLPFPEETPTTTTVEITIKIMITCKALVATDMNALRAFFGGLNLAPEPPREEEKSLTGFGLIEAAGEVVEGELKSITPKTLTKDDF